LAAFFTGLANGQTPDAENVATLTQKAHRIASSAKTLEEYTEALKVCGQAMKAGPTEKQKEYINQLAGWAYNKRGETLVKLAESTAATDAKSAAEYEQVAVKDFGLAAQFTPSDWKPRFNRAVSVAMLGDYKLALNDLDFVIRSQPNHKNALFNRAEILLQQGRYEHAIADYTEVLKLNPNDSAAYAGRGIALSALGDTQNALGDLNHVVRLQPENAQAYVDRADLYAALGNWERAAGDYRVAIRLDDTMGRAYQNVAWMMATCPEKRFRNPNLAVRAAERAIKLDGETYLSLDTLAAALASVGKFNEAQQAQQRAIAAAPEGDRSDLMQRMALYQQSRPFIERPVTGNVQLATAEEEVMQTK
jgi:tetratricopeptide (TPR) repeat protein